MWHAYHLGDTTKGSDRLLSFSTTSDQVGTVLCVRYKAYFKARGIVCMEELYAMELDSSAAWKNLLYVRWKGNS